MIQKMKKFTFLVTSMEYESFIENVRKIGVLQIDELQTGLTNEELQNYQATADRFKNAIKNLDFAKENYSTDEKFKEKSADSKRGNELLATIENLIDKENQLKHELEATNKDIEALEPWGEFDWERVNKLKDEGYSMNFFVCSSKSFKKEWSEEYFATPILETSTKTYFVTFSSETPDITAERLLLPERKLSEYKEQKGNLETQIEDIHKSLLKINAEERDSILAAQIDNENSISLTKVHLSSESLANDAVKMFVGWTLAEKANTLVDYLEKNRIFYKEEDPGIEDDVPVQIKNDSYSRLFEPILRMYALPKYQDLDMTPFLAPFFMLFFGLCMCDAGYGLIIFFASLLLRSKLKPEMKGYASLGMFLGGMTTICGLLTGSFVGIDLTQQDWAFLAPMKPYFINESNFKIFGYSPMMIISIFIGFIQVMLGMILSAIKSAKLNGWIYGVGKMSWVVALISATICFGAPACGANIPVVATYILYALILISVLGIFFLNSPGKNIFLNFGTGLWDTYGMATGLLGDLLSYIRLFALGLTGGVLGGVFNSLAIDMTSSLPWAIRWLPMLLILLAGHGINFALCMISSFVHPMRLTFVEFFKNANFEGGGREFNPFKIKVFKKD